MYRVVLAKEKKLPLLIRTVSKICYFNIKLFSKENFEDSLNNATIENDTSYKMGMLTT